MTEWQFLTRPKKTKALTPKRAKTLCRTCRFLCEGDRRTCCRRWKEPIEIEDFSRRKKVCGCYKWEPEPGGQNENGGRK